MHPVQAALVETHGTQCGFCTPGFVMAMFAFDAGGEAATDAAIHDALAGNLCRCTGYRPIVDAMRKLGGADATHLDNAGRVHPAPSPARGEGESTPSVAKSEPSPRGSIAASDSFTHRREKFHAPRDLDRVIELRAKNPKAVLLGGGTDLGLVASKGRQRFGTVISLARVAALHAVREVEGRLEIGGAATYSEALPSLDRLFPAFGALVHRIGSRQIRNLGTIAGNLGTASPIGDTLPCLMALGAKVRLLSRRGQRDRTIEDFIVGYRKIDLRDDEVIAAIGVPLLAPTDRLFVYKISKRFDQDISAVVAAFLLRFDGAVVRESRLAFGGMADRTKRAPAAEAALTGRPFDAAAAEAAGHVLAGDLSPLSDFRATAEYRRTVAANLLRRAQLQASEPATAVEVTAL
jgi:xanthine dehydrogenase small subunit